jgi:hypothetical protein
MWTVRTCFSPIDHTRRMPRRNPIPPALVGRPFAVSAALAAGVSKDRLRSKDLQKPFHGVRAIGLDLDLLESRCRAYAARMRSDHVFSHLTAALVLGIPLPEISDCLTVHVTAPRPHRAPRGRGFVGHQEEFDAADVMVIRGIRITPPALTWCALANLLDLPDLVAAGDYLVTGRPFENVLPFLTLAELKAATAVKVGARGQRARIAALALIREGPLSRPETLVRLLLGSAGIPEPQINEPVYDPRGSFVATPDLTWPQFRVALEYEGDHHREVKQFRKDIGRIERLIDEGWSVMKVSADDLFVRPGELIERAERRLRSAGWSGSIRQLRQIGQFRR